MYEEKNLIRKTRMIWGAITIFFALTGLLSTKLMNIELYWDFALILMSLSYIMFIVGLAFFICALTTKYKVYHYNKYELLVYVGLRTLYLKVNGKIMDEHITLFRYTPIMLDCTLEDGTKITATISTSNNITLKINNRLVR